jgi:hypothetical protein
VSSVPVSPAASASALKMATIVADPSAIGINEMFFERDLFM